MCCKGLSIDDVGVSRSTVFQETRPEAGFETADFVKIKVLGGRLPSNDSMVGRDLCSAILSRQRLFT